MTDIEKLNRVNNIYTDDTSMFVDYANRNYQLTAEGSAKYGNTLNLSTVGPKIDMVGAEKYAEAKVALPKANGKAPAAPSVSMPEKVKDAVSKRNVDEVKSAMEELEKIWEPIVQRIYPVNEQQFNFDPSQFGGANGNPENPFMKAN